MFSVSVRHSNTLKDEQQPHKLTGQQTHGEIYISELKGGKETQINVVCCGNTAYSMTQ